MTCEIVLHLTRAMEGSGQKTPTSSSSDTKDNKSRIANMRNGRNKSGLNVTALVFGMY